MTAVSRRRIAVVGLGMAVTPHAQSLRDLAQRVEIVAAYSRSAERRDAFAKRFGFPVTDDLDLFHRVQQRRPERRGCMNATSLPPTLQRYELGQRSISSTTHGNV